MFFVRSATEQDLPAVSRLLGAAWHATYDALYGVDKVNELTASWHSVAALKARLANPASEFVVADNGRMLGGMGYAAMSAKTKTVMLHQLYVHPDFLHQGIGADMFAELETCFPDAERMELEVDRRNLAAIAFYQRLGFAETGSTENCGAGQSGIPALIFSKSLG